MFRVPDDDAGHNNRRTLVRSGVEEDYLKPWLSRRNVENNAVKSRVDQSLQIEKNVNACQCDGISRRCHTDELESGSPVSICLWTQSGFFSVLEMTMKHNDKVAVPIFYGVANDFTEVEEFQSSVVVHTMMLPDIESDSIPSNVVVEGTVYFSLGEGDRNLFEPVDENFFHVEIPLMRPSNLAPTFQSALLTTFQRPDFLVSLIVIFILWCGLCIVVCCGHRDRKGRKNNASESTAQLEKEETSEMDDESLNKR